MHLNSLKFNVFMPKLQGFNDKRSENWIYNWIVEHDFLKFNVLNSPSAQRTTVLLRL